MSRRYGLVVRSALAGAACGCRALTGPAAVALGEPGGLPRWLPKVVTVLAVGELAADKLPMAPSRLEPPGLAARLVTAGACAGQLTRTTVVAPSATDSDSDAIDRRRLAVSVGVAMATAGLSAWAGSRWRASGFARHRPIPAALLEDGVAVLMAGAAARG